MPIEIRQLEIKGEIVNPKKEDLYKSLEIIDNLNYFKDEIIEQCIEKLEDYLKKKNDR